MNADLILASASPRRRELLERLGLRLRVQPPHIDETPEPHEEPRTYVRRVARRKCEALLASPRDQALPVLAADTTVILDETILGKPADADEARSMLQRLAGRRHEVATAFCIAFGERLVERTVSTQVVFRLLDPAEVQAYVDSREWDGKAGGYAIQDRAAAFVTELRGSVTNVIGLPLAEVLADLRAVGALAHYPAPAFGASP